MPPEAGPDFVAGYSYLTPVVAMSVYLDWLEQCAPALAAPLALLPAPRLRVVRVTRREAPLDNSACCV